MAWRHCVVHVFTRELFGISTTLIDLYLDGERVEAASLSAQLTGASAVATVGVGLSASSLRLGIDADPRSQLQLDQLRVYDLSTSDNDNWLEKSELRALRTERAAEVRAQRPKLRFDFESLPDGGSFANGGSLAGVGIGPIAADPEQIYAGSWARLDIQEVATRLDSTLDAAGFGGSGYILNAVSNYNANLYDREAELGQWGPIFPVNHGQVYSAAENRLEVAYYENPFVWTRSSIRMSPGRIVRPPMMR